MLEDKDRMPEQIDRVLATIRAAWLKYPNWGLGQLLIDACAPSLRIEDFFYADDETIIEKLEAHDERVQRELAEEIKNRARPSSD